ncbi:hydroxymethylglutaryl-CoA reductase [Flagelloscypha sp. PMI_526]|nr:hydroxymethylglutaryl-CoA reductase [Flagelloscypha sp. PMI_526]
MLSKMRTVLKPLAVHAAYSPIETIVFFSTFDFSCYYLILPSSLLPNYVALRPNSWEPIRESRLVQVLYTLTGAKDGVNLATPPLSTALQNATTHSGLDYTHLCYRASPSAPCFVSFWGTPRTATQTLAITFSNGDYDAATEGVSFDIERTASDDQSLSSYEVILLALFHRFYHLALKADSLDILLVLVGYALMHYTFLLLFTRSRRLCGSSFWLPMSILTSSVLALLIALPLGMKLGLKMDIVALTEAFPFIVCTVGFDKPLRLARAVFGHEHILKPPTKNGPLKPAGRVILDSLDAVYQPILPSSAVSGLKEVCSLAALLLSIDCVMMCTYLSSMLTIMVEVRRIQTARDGAKKSRSRSSSVSPRIRSAMSRTSSSASLTTGTEPSGLRHRLSSTLLGVKESKTYGYKEDKEENPVAKLKLLLIASFTILHVLNFITPLTTAPRPDGSTSQQVTEFRKVDVATESMRSVLTSLAEVSFTPQNSDTLKELYVRIAPPVQIQVVPPPSMQQSKPTGSQLTVLSGVPFLASTVSAGSASMLLDRFTSSWTAFVGDPVMSKWIVVALVISISLNGYLLNGIASGLAGIRSSASGVRFRSMERGDREEPVSFQLSAPTPVKKTPPPTQIHEEPVSRHRKSSVESGGLEIRAAMKPKGATFTLEDVDRKLKAQQLSEVDRKLQAQAQSGKLTVHTPITPATPRSMIKEPTNLDASANVTVRSLEECIDIMNEEGKAGLKRLNDEEVILLSQNGKIAAYALEKVLGSDELERAVKIRRALISRSSLTKTLESSDIPTANYDYSRVLGACCENVVGYIPIPMGIAGPLKIDGILCPIPMATAEGTLVASTSRGCKALNAGGGVTTVLTQDAMTRGPAIDFPSVVEAAQAKAWIDSECGYTKMKTAFESTSRFAKLQSMKTAMAGRTLFVRFATATGDAMGMNMISKGTEKALDVMQQQFPDMIILALSGNYCTDKKPAAINWIEGRGKSVVAEAVVPGRVVKSVLKTTVEALCNLNTKKNLIGSAMAGSIGGFNAHAANILTAIFLATGQDPAQNVESSNCMTLMEPINNGEDLLVTISMPSIEVGTVGGGTVLAPQGAVLEMLGIKGAHPTSPGKNSQNLARIIASAVMAGELSLMSALAAGHLIRAHMAHNRSQTNTPSVSAPITPSSASEPVVLVPSSSDKPSEPLAKSDSLPPYSK